MLHIPIRAHAAALWCAVRADSFASLQTKIQHFKGKKKEIAKEW